METWIRKPAPRFEFLKTDSMKRLFTTLLSSLVLMPTLWAQTAQDSVKIRLETSAGCEIGIDGEMSSTNIMTEKVTIGKHEVTVTFGTTFSKTYHIEVTREGENKFTFPISGQLTVTSTPTDADIFVDGLRVAKSPATVDVLGTHNIRVSKDEAIWVPQSQRVTVYPFSNEQINFTLKKQPPKRYGMVLANYGFENNSFGLMLGLCRRFGGYFRIQMTANQDFGDGEAEFTTNQGYRKLKDPALGCFTGGLMYRCSRHLYLYAGAGVISYSHGIYGDENDTPYCADGLGVDAGAILKWKALLLSCGYNTVVAGDITDGYRYGNIYVGLGITIRKNKKR